MRALDYKDISLVSRQISTISSRDEIDTSVEFCGRKLSVPIIASPMKDVCDGYIAKLMMDNGAFGIIHRFSSIAQQVAEYQVAPGAGCAIGITGDWFERFEALYQAGCRIFCLDIASRANTAIIPALEKLYISDDLHFIVGNVASAEGFEFCAKQLGVSAVRLGVAGGAGCTTKNATGIYFPMFSLIDEIYKYNIGTPIKTIADGGIKEPGDFCKAIGIGADVVMLGSLIANTIESPARVIKENEQLYTVYHGSASSEIQKLYRETPRYIEGRQVLLDFHNEHLVSLLNRFIEGLKSSMSYFNARNLNEYRCNINYVELNS